MIRAVAWWEEHPDGTAGYSTDEADSILAMPEMHEIKAVLSCAMEVLTDAADQAKIEHLREAVAAASSSVIDWVMGGPTCHSSSLATSSNNRRTPND
jgi:hypothetical protein